MNQAGWISVIGTTMILMIIVPGLAAYDIGDTVDDFFLFDADNVPVRLHDFEDQVILINFWRAD
jgi:hypothetical protein